MNNRSILIVIAVLAIIAAIIFGYTSLVEENSRFITELSLQEATIRLGQSQEINLREELRLVTEQGQELQKERVSLKDALRDSQYRILTLGNSYYRLAELDAVMAAHIDQVAQDNFSLVRGRDSLEDQFADIVKENEVFKARLGSVEELRKAMREVHINRSGTR
jgi:hypothetical protein